MRYAHKHSLAALLILTSMSTNAMPCLDELSHVLIAAWGVEIRELNLSGTKDSDVTNLCSAMRRGTSVRIEPNNPSRTTTAWVQKSADKGQYPLRLTINGLQKVRVPKRDIEAGQPLVAEDFEDSWAPVGLPRQLFTAALDARWYAAVDLPKEHPITETMTRPFTTVKAGDLLQVSSTYRSATVNTTALALANGNAGNNVSAMTSGGEKMQVRITAPGQAKVIP